MRTRRVCGLLVLFVGSLAGLGEACGGSGSSSPTDSGAPLPDGGSDSSAAVDTGADSAAAIDSSAAIDSGADVGADSRADGPDNLEGGGQGYPCFDSGICDPATQYCYLDTMNGAFLPSCTALPFGCTAPSCACFDAGGTPGLGCTCTDAPDSGLLVNCTAP
jgi:hypothetical protein